MILERESEYYKNSNYSENYISNYLRCTKESISAAETLVKEGHGYEAFALAGRGLKLAINYFCIINKIPYDKQADYSDNLEAISYYRKHLPLTEYVFEDIGRYLNCFNYPMYGRMRGIDVDEAVLEAKKSILNIEESCNEVLNKEEK